MILANGIVYPSSEQGRILAELETQLPAVCALRPRLTTGQVIAALDRMSRKILDGAFDELITDDSLRPQVQYAAGQLSREALEHKVQTELGAHWEEPAVSAVSGLTVQTMPLGVILHIAAGNMDALPAWSVIEGLLTGNINLLKLPQADSGLTIRFFQAFLEDSPYLKEHIYVFDTPSTDIAGMQALAALSDGIAVWGGDAAVSAVRQLAPVGCKLIEWGHRLGFCYISGEPSDPDLTALASHIMETRQLLCSSCQVIYLNTEDAEQTAAFCRRFLPILERAAERFPVDEPGAVAELTLRRFTEALEAAISSTRPANHIYQGQYTSLTACADSRLELSGLYGNVLVKPLPIAGLPQVLRDAKGCLQTAGLLCPESERDDLTQLLFRCGVNRVLPPGEMSAAFPGEPHDGEYPLRRYTRIVMCK